MTRKKVKIMMSIVIVVLIFSSSSVITKDHKENVPFQEEINFLDIKSSDTTVNYSKSARNRIYFDMSKEQVFSIWDTSFMGYSELCIMLQRYGLETTTITTGLLEYLPIMTSEDILFLNLAKYASYSISELNGILDFVDNGGKLIVLGEHDVFNFTQFQNPLLEHFGMEFTTMPIRDFYHNIDGIPDWPVFDSSYFGINNLSIMGGAVVNVSGPAFSIANSSIDAFENPNKPIMAGYSNGNGGKVFACADAEWIWNANGKVGGIHYGNNSKLVLELLDWFYNTNGSSIIENNVFITPQYQLFTHPLNSNFTLNVSVTHSCNISAQIYGGNCAKTQEINSIGNSSWEINITGDGFARFEFVNDVYGFNTSNTVYFLAGDSGDKVLFLGNNFSRGLDASPSGLLSFARDLRDSGYSIYASEDDIEYSQFNQLILAIPLQEISPSVISTTINHNGRLLLLNQPLGSLDMNDPMAGFFTYMYYNFTANEIPINAIASPLGVNFTHYLLCNSEFNENDKIYVPKIMGANSTFYNISAYKPSLLNVSAEYTQELFGYEGSWGEDRSIFGTAYEMEDPDHDFGDVNSTTVLAYTNATMASGMLHHFTNEYYNPDHFFNEFVLYWIESGKFNRKHEVQLNQSVTKINQEFEIIASDLKDVNDSLIPDGTVFNVIHSLGEILSEDALPAIDGFQVISYNASINVTMSSGLENGLFQICMYNTSPYYSVASGTTRFSFDNIPPLLVTHYPQNNSYWNYAPAINVTVFEEEIDSFWYNVSGFTEMYFLQNKTEVLLNDTIWEALEEGEFTLQINANDTSGNTNTGTMLLIKDTIAPTIDVVLPLNESIWNVPPNLLVISNDDYQVNISYEVSGTIFQLVNGTEEELDVNKWNTLLDGVFTITFHSRDIAGNSNSSSVTCFKDATGPTIELVSPEHLTSHAVPPSIHVKVFEKEIDRIWYYIVGISGKYFLVNHTTESLDNDLWSLISDGSFILQVYANDSVGNWNNQEITLYKDTTSPALEIIDPLNSTLWRDPPSILVRSTDPDVDRIWYEVAGSSYLLMNDVSDTIDGTTWNGIPNGVVVISFMVNDTTGNIFQKNITVIKDTTAPLMQILSPRDSDVFGSQPPFYNISVFDTSGIDEIWYEINNQSIHIGSMSGYIDQDIWKSLPDGDIHLIFRSTDILGNQESVFIIVVKHTQLTRDDFPIWIAIIISASGVSIIAAAYIYYRRFYLKRRDE